MSKCVQAMTDLYWPNGKLKRSVEFQDGKRSGPDRMWNEHGILVDEGFYEKGEPIGVHKRWNANGDLIEEIQYNGCKKNYRLWDDEGTIRAEGMWVCDEYIERAWDRFQNVWVGRQETQPRMIENVPLPIGASDDGLAILMERFPLLGLLYPTMEQQEVVPEYLEPFDIGKADLIVVFGLRMGAPYFQLKNWLHEKSHRKLVFIEEHFAYFIAHSPHVSLFKDPQVFLEMEFIPEKYPFQRIEVVGLSKKQKLKVLRKMTLAHALHQDRLHGDQPFQNFVRNEVRLSQSFYANALKGKFTGVPAIVCGAGPSLQKAIPTLKKLSERALIIAGGSTIAALSSQGVPIHFGVAIDPNLEEYRRLKNSFAFDTPLLYSTRVHPDVFQTCSGPFGYMRSGIGGTMEVWMEEELGLLDPMIGHNLSPESISVTTICTAWAQYLGCSSVFFSGLDLAYTNKKRYAEGVDGDEEISFNDHEREKSAADRIIRRKNRQGKMIHTAVRWIMEAAALSHFAKKHKEIRWVNTTDDGLPIPGVPYMDLEKVDFSQTFDLKSRVAEEIANALMPNSHGKMEPFIQSLNRVIEHLEIIVGNKPGAAALAELELQEELANQLLFYDVKEILGIGKWEDFLTLARKYKSAL